MGKNFLVASFYNPITKKYENEQEIIINDMCLNNLAEIDKYDEFSVGVKVKLTEFYNMIFLQSNVNVCG